MYCDVSSDDTVGDLECPQSFQITPILTFWVFRLTGGTAEATVFKFLYPDRPYQVLALD